MASIDETHGGVGTVTPHLVNSLTFTGFDQRCDIAELIEIAARARPLRIERAVLAGTSTGNDPRFPDLETIARFRDRTAAAGTAAALHLCGRLARAVAAGDLDEAVGLGAGFRRIQINAPSHDYGQLAKLANRTGARVIAQEQHGFADKRAPSERLQYLDDGSGGRGISQTARLDERMGPRALRLRRRRRPRQQSERPSTGRRTRAARTPGSTWRAASGRTNGSTPRRSTP